MIFNDGWINDRIRPCHLGLSALALCLCPSLLSLHRFLLFFFWEILTYSFLPSFPCSQPPLPSFSSAAIFLPFILPCQAYVSRGCCFLNKELLIELCSPASERSSSCNTCTRARTDGSYRKDAWRFSFFWCFLKGAIFVLSK